MITSKYRGLIVLTAAGWLAAMAGQALAQTVAQIDDRQVVAGTSAAPDPGETAHAGPAASEPEAIASAPADTPPDKSRNLAIARTLLLLMGGGGTARPFPLLPK